MTPQQLWKLAYRTCESKLRKSGAVFSEAEIMAEMPVVDEFPFKWKEVVNLDSIDSAEVTPELLDLMKSRIEAAHETMRKNATAAMYGDLEVKAAGPEDLTRDAVKYHFGKAGVAMGNKEFKND